MFAHHTLTSRWQGPGVRAAQTLREHTACRQSDARLRAQALCRYADGTNSVTGEDTRKSLGCGSRRRFREASPSNPEGPQARPAPCAVPHYTLLRGHEGVKVFRKGMECPWCGRHLATAWSVASDAFVAALPRCASSQSGRLKNSRGQVAVHACSTAVLTCIWSHTAVSGGMRLISLAPRLAARWPPRTRRRSSSRCPFTGSEGALTCALSGDQMSSLGLPTVPGAEAVCAQASAALGC
jgi:hypothetical protein